MGFVKGSLSESDQLYPFHKADRTVNKTDKKKNFEKAKISHRFNTYFPNGITNSLCLGP